MADKYLTPSDFFGKRTIYDALLSVDSHVQSLLKFDSQNFALYDNLVNGSFSYYSDLAIHWLGSVDLDSLALQVGEIRSVVVDTFIPSDLGHDVTVGEGFLFTCRFTDGTYVFSPSFKTADFKTFNSNSRNNDLSLGGNFVLGGSGFNITFKLIVKRIS